MLLRGIETRRIEAELPLNSRVRSLPIHLAIIGDFFEYFVVGGGVTGVCDGSQGYSSV